MIIDDGLPSQMRYRDYHITASAVGRISLPEHVMGSSWTGVAIHVILKGGYRQAKQLRVKRWLRRNTTREEKRFSTIVSRCAITPQGQEQFTHQVYTPSARLTRCAQCNANVITA